MVNSRQTRYALIFLIPAGIGLFFFYLLPALRGFYFSFTDYAVLTPEKWTGLANYRRLIHDPLFWNAVKVTVYYVVLNIGFQIIIAIVLAVLLQRLTNSTIIRGMALLPYFIANVVVALVWYFMMDFQIGVAAAVMIGQTLFSAMAAYAFSRLRWRGRDAVFALFLSALMVPSIFTAIPNFVLIKQLGLLNTFAGIILPTFFMTPFSIFFLRQFFLGIPREIDEAAMIDGAGPFRVFFRVICPMSSAPIITLAVLTFINAWNDYMWPLLVGQSDNVRVLTVALGIFRSQTPQGSPDWTALMAAALVAALPIIILFIILGKRIVNSVGFSGIK